MTPSPSARRCILLGITGTQAHVGGIASNNRNIIAALAALASDRGRRLRVVSLWDGDSRPPFAPTEVEYLGCAGNKLRFAARVIERSAFAEVAAFDHVGVALPLLPLAALGAVKTVIFAHGSEGSGRLTMRGRWSFQSARLVLTNSAFTLKRMKSAFGGFKGQACELGLPHGVALNTAPPEPAATSARLAAADGVERVLGPQYFLLVARIDPTEGLKGHHQMMAALAAIADAYPRVELVFAGPGAGRAALIEQAARLGVADRVFLPGQLSRAALDALYQGCYAFTMPSRQEGFGIVYLEAMNWAKTCIGCREDGAREVIVDGETGILVDNPDDAGELAAAMRKLLEQPELARRLGVNGFRRLHERFTAEHAQRRIRSAVEGLIR